MTLQNESLSLDTKAKRKDANLFKLSAKKFIDTEISIGICKKTTLNFASTHMLIKTLLLTEC